MQYKATKIRMYPDVLQETYLKKSCGVARLSYNWAVAEWDRRHKSGERVNEGMLRRHFNSIKRETYPFVTEVSKCVPQQAIKNLGKAYANFFRDIKKKSSRKSGHPRFKKKGVRDSFYLDTENIKTIDKSVRLPLLEKPVKLAVCVPDGRLISATISRESDRWYVSVLQEVEDFVPPKATHDVVGVDLGVTSIAVLSDGCVLESDRLLKIKTKRLARLQRNLSKKVKGSNNRSKSKVKLSTLHAQIRNRRKDVLHQLTTRIVKKYNTVVVEDLNVSGMLKNHKLARSIQQVGFGMFRQLLTYKCTKYQRKLILAPRFYPSTKTCSMCGNVKESMKMSERLYDCSHCGTKICRDLNAAKNLEKLGTCCPDVKPVETLSDTRKKVQRSTKQEVQLPMNADGISLLVGLSNQNGAVAKCLPSR